MNIPLWLSKHFNESEVSKVEVAVGEAEKVTKAEIVPFVTRKATSPQRTDLNRLGAILQVLFYGLLVAVVVTGDQSNLVIVAVIGIWLAKIRTQVIKNKYLDDLVWQRAVREFQESKMYKTVNQTGVMIFLSLEDKKVVILADPRVDEKVPKGTWDQLSNHMVEEISKNGVPKAFVSTIQELSCILAGAVPKENDLVDELPNQLVIKE